MPNAIGTAPNQIPTNANLGTAAYRDSGEFATSAQGDTADTAYQPSDLASQAQAEAGTDNTTLMTPLRTSQAITALAPSDTVAALTPAATVDVDLSTGTIFTLTPDQNTTFTLSNTTAVDSFTLTLTGFGIILDYDISSASYDTVSVSLAAQDTSFNDMFFRADGLKFYMVGSATDTIYQYTLSTAWDLTTLAYDSVSFPTSPESNATGLYFKPDGTEVYFCGTAFQDVRQYTLSTAWDVSTATLTDQFSIGSTPRGITLKPDGTKIFSIHGDQRIYSHTLSTAWDLTTASTDAGSLLVSSQDTACQALDFSADGTKMFVIGQSSASVHQYTLSTPWDKGTATYDNVAFSFADQDTGPTAISFVNGGTRMVMGGIVGDAIYQYSLAVPATLTYPAAFKWAGGTAPDAPADGEVDVLTFFTTDTGTTWYGFQDGDAMA